ncbi:hemicentin-1-like [Condylostylus longicornis]|uniref:hemicentin-1-like n=1 Tax=Condylostylus longicornis TaxID=2530218 RepID=UPI00244D9B6B|nr:hemicentin-1-like [Condylostylus longicornis]
MTVKLTVMLYDSLAILALVLAEEALDTREGEDLILKCRFNEQQRSSEFSYYWARWTTNPVKFENVAIGDIQLNSNYRLDFRPDKGIYDLQIRNVSYNRDNGRFECRVKARGTGADVHQEHYNLTVLTPPQPPLVAPGAIAVTTEDKKTDLTCSSIGGSPDPIIHWYRDGSPVPLQAPLNRGGSKDLHTTSTLSVTPRREDDGARYKCVVWNRAMPEGEKLETTVTLNVNYYPRVEVGPANPLRVERERTAKLECNVDSKPKVSNVRWTREGTDGRTDGRYIGSQFIHSIQRVSEQDAGKYKCTADNGLGRTGEQEIFLDVLYAPSVVIESKTREAEEGAPVSIRCNVTSNPKPVTIEWLKEGSPDFRYNGEVLNLGSVRAENAGNYVCRAVNIMEPFDGKRVERVGNSTVALLIRHRPGQSFITPNKPIVHVGNGVTLTCSANPPGWPVPQYRWFRDLDGEFTGSNSKILAQGSQYIIPRAHLGSEGKYHCHAVNELGIGEMATIILEVHQPPQFLAKLQQHMTRRTGDTDYAVTCSAKAKPKPSVRWLKDGSEILPELNLYEVKTNPIQGSNGMVTVQSMLKFHGKARPNNNQLIPGDRGMYTCLYENEVSQANSTMHLRIEHEPIVLNQYNKVATDIRETAEVICRVQAYPKPEFQWLYGNNPSPLSMSSDGHYEIHTSSDNNDIYTSVLRINQLVHNDYGDYTCRATNSQDAVRTVIRLQQKGKPEKPTNVQAKEIGPNFVTLVWDSGFDGGLSNTMKFFVAYRRVSTPQKEQMISDCATLATSNTDWMEYDCQRESPCKIQPLDQHQSYAFKVKARNAKGESEFSHEVLTTTKVSKIPPPLHVTFDPNSRTLGINVGATCLALIAVVETLINRDTPSAAWEIVDTVQLQVSGNGPTFKETVIHHLAIPRRSGNARSLGSLVLEDDVPMALEDDMGPTVRVKLCLKSNNEHCGDYAEAEIGSSYIAEASALPIPTLIAIIVSCIVFALFVGLLLMFCRCKRNQSKKSAAAKDYEMDSVRPSIVAQQNQAPPPYYPASGLDNKALEHSMDLALSMEDQKTAVYASQNGFSYHPNTGIQVPQHTIPGNEWVNMSYIENSYSNSNNGGSVNSQDSLWQVKMSAAAGNQTNLVPSHNFVDRQPSYGYDPLTHGGYGAVDDYAPYPHLTTTSSQHGDEYHNMRNSQNPSRQDYCSDPYASVQKPKKRVDQHLDSPYHDVSGLPDPYMEQMEQDDTKPPQQHMSLSYDENLESGYSTPNSRNRRVIREIIV